MQYLGKETVNFTFTFNPVKGRSWPAVNILVNNFQVSTQELTSDNNQVSVDVAMSSTPNNISICFYSKQERETVISNGEIIADQSLELISVHADDILLESWFWTDHCYLPQYFQGYKKQFPNAPVSQPSQLIWHFPGRYMINNLPDSAEFWNWYQVTRTQRILKTLIDPTGQITSNYEAIDNEDIQLIQDIKKLIDV